MSWKPVTETAANLPNDAIPFIQTARDRDTVAMCRLELEAMRRFRMPEGVTVGEATQEEYDAAVVAFRRTL